MYVCYTRFMSVTATALLALLLSLPRFTRDTETAEEREVRMSVVDRSLVYASDRATCSGEYDVPGCHKWWTGSKKSLQVLLVVQAKYETNFAQHIHEGRCRLHLKECDGGRAKGLWQLHAGGTVTKEEWEQFEGTSLENTKVAAWAAARVMMRSLGACKGDLEGGFAMYATGNSCTWSGAKERADLYRQLMKRK